MATDATGQTPTVIAKDLVIAAIAAKSVPLNGNPKRSAEEIAEMYRIILAAVKSPAVSGNG